MEGIRMIYAYLRVSTKDQNLDRQVVAVKAYRPELLDENTFSDKQSGKNFERTEYLRLESFCICNGVDCPERNSDIFLQRKGD